MGIWRPVPKALERTRMIAERVMRELFAWPIVLPGELVYFARTAALIEGIGSRYDANFNSIRVASPVVLRMRRELLVALVGEAGVQDPWVRWGATLGAVAGGAVALLGTARTRWSEIAAARWTKFIDDTRDAPSNENAPAGT